MIRGVKENGKVKGWSVVKALIHSHNVEGQGRLGWGGNGKNLSPQGVFKFRVNLAKGTEKIHRTHTGVTSHSMER